ncbi:TonB-dependent receptor [Sphingomonas sp. ID1715]|uniref:TonB-dependent receptor plug domain-containing protein n=1 Tax=Sphingomonas sp. ID1715 TaxID=1656898 RepID=UPI00148854AC|nr:TonB-dependent receptor [Sphingomonas sp. ID1715]NNM78707.1 TonB-dependent receptor [Sphingomonas sp. ID1715]
MRSYLLTLTALCAAPALAQSADDSGPDVVVTATRSGEPTPIRDVGASITLLSPETLTDRQTRSVADILRDVPGVAVNRTTGLTQLRLRGSEANQLLVLIDGIEASDPFLSEFDFGSLVADENARIEVLRGQQSALYGSDAIGGVVHYITASGREAPGFSARVEGGTQATANAMLRAAGVAGDFDYAATGTLLTTDGAPDARKGTRDLGSDTVSAALKLNWSPLPNFRLGAVGRFTDVARDFNDQNFSVAGPSFGLVVDSPGVRSHNRNWNGLLRAELDTLGGRWTHAVTGQFTDARRDTFAFDDRTSGSQGERLKGSYETALRFDTGSIRHRVTFALDLERERFRNRDPNGFAFNGRREVKNTGLVGQYELFFGDRAGLSASVRRDDNSLFANTTTYRVQGSYAVLDGTRLHAAAGSGVKNPNLFELYGFIDGRFLGNPDLKPEKSEGWEAGVEQRLFGDRVTVGATYFENVLDDEIYTDFPPPLFTPTSLNRATKSRQHGVEAALAARFGEAWRVDAAYTYLKARENGVTEVRRPKHIASVSTTWSAPGDTASVTLVGRYNGRQLDQAFLDPSFVPTIVRLDDYVLVNLNARARLSDRFELFGRVENLFDERYEDVFSFVNPGRTAVAGVRVRL